MQEPKPTDKHFTLSWTHNTNTFILVLTILAAFIPQVQDLLLQFGDQLPEQLVSQLTHFLVGAMALVNILLRWKTRGEIKLNPPKK